MSEEFTASQLQDWNDDWMDQIFEKQLRDEAYKNLVDKWTVIIL